MSRKGPVKLKTFKLYRVSFPLLTIPTMGMGTEQSCLSWRIQGTNGLLDNTKDDITVAYSSHKDQVASYHWQRNFFQIWLQYGAFLYCKVVSYHRQRNRFQSEWQHGAILYCNCWWIQQEFKVVTVSFVAAFDAFSRMSTGAICNITFFGAQPNTMLYAIIAHPPQSCSLHGWMDVNMSPSVHCLVRHGFRMG